jgi:chorismate synthase
MSNSIGKFFKVTTFGESHGICIGAVIDGCPAGQEIDLDYIQDELNRRRPGQSSVTTTRNEPDRLEVLSGLFQGFTTGAPICMLVRNSDSDSSKYEELKSTPRPGHADYAAEARYGGYQDYRGGGRFSGRNTAALVIAGALAKQILMEVSVKVLAYTSQIGNVISREVLHDLSIEQVESSIIRCPDPELSEKMIKLIDETKNEEDSLGGKVTCVVLNMPPGVGDPYFDTLEGDLSKAIFSIPAVKAVEFGAGTKYAYMRGSESNDPFAIREGKVVTTSNNSGGIQGGISNGMPIVISVTFKPTPSISKPQRTVDLDIKSDTIIRISGRHDPCIVPRAVPVIENVAAIVLLDHLMRRGIVKQVVRRDDVRRGG